MYPELQEEVIQIGEMKRGERAKGKKECEEQKEGRIRLNERERNLETN